MTKKELIDAGYTRYDPVLYQDCVTDMYQKVIKDDIGKRYAITIERWDFSRIAPRRRDIKPSYETTVQFTHKNGQVVDIVCYDGWELDQLEQYYANLWDSGCYQYYERFWGHEYDEES